MWTKLTLCWDDFFNFYDGKRLSNEKVMSVLKRLEEDVYVLQRITRGGHGDKRFSVLAEL